VAALSATSRRHLAVAGTFAAFALLWSYPLALRLSSHIPGEGPGDNVAFLWSFWWMRESLAAGTDPFHTPLLFAPAGTDLSLNTHLALPAFFGATFLGGLPLVAAFNVTLLVTLFLNGLCAYWLAWRATRDHAAALVAGLVFAGSPYVAARLHGHFNLLSAWTLPLFALAVPGAVRGSMAAAAAAGVVLGATAYVDYYYVIFQLALAAFAVAFAGWRWEVTRREPAHGARRLARVLWVLLALDAVVLAAIATTGGFTITLGPVRISAQDSFNARQALWVLLAGLVWVHSRPHLRLARSVDWNGPRAATALLVMLGVFLALAAPLLWHVAGLVLRHEYVSQRYYWRSAPKGIDVVTLLLGNPFHGLWGDSVGGLYDRLGIDRLEACAWIGVAPLALAFWGASRRRREDAARYWTAVAALFFVWALGPHLMAFGANTGMILPQTVLRFVPLAANARIPGRAIVLVHLAVALLAALAIARWRAGGSRRLLAVAGIALVVVADDMVAPFPLVALERPAIYETIRDRPERGSVYELPMGTRDSFHERGRLDHRTLFYQTIHERPIAGGVVSRLSPAVRAAYEADPLLSALLRLSEGAEEPRQRLPGRDEGRDLLSAQGVAFVVLNRAGAPPGLVRYAEDVLPLRLIRTDGERSLYEVER
jgi:hypothetical protein